jgi:hypothetical protein
MRPSGTWQRPRATIWCGGSFEMSSPLKVMPPCFARSRPEMVRRVVVLPAPLPPMSVTMRPASMWNDTPAAR